MARTKIKPKHQADPSPYPVASNQRKLSKNKKKRGPLKKSKVVPKTVTALEDKSKKLVTPEYSEEEHEKVEADEWLGSDDNDEMIDELPQDEIDQTDSEEDLIEKSKQAALENMENEELARLELQKNLEQDDQLEEEDKFKLPTQEEIEKETNDCDLTVVHQRINTLIQILTNKKLMRKEHARHEYVDQLVKDIMVYYGYTKFIVDKVLALFKPSEAYEFFESNEVSRPLTIRTNTLKTHRRDLAAKLIQRGVNLDPLGEWTDVGLQVFDCNIPIGATPEYLTGLYTIQAASSMLPVMALSPKPNEFILDMCAAPGGKTTYIGALMRNTGCIVANDMKKHRTKGLIANIHRMGLTNTIVTSYSGDEIVKITQNFDRILLDAPCTGTGVISKDASVKSSRDKSDLQRVSSTQKKLILSAIDCLNARKHPATLIYSTCSVLVEENEEIVDYALKMRPNIRVVDTGLKFGVSGYKRIGGKVFHPSLAQTKRYYPHTHNMDGFFIAKIEKISNNIQNKNKE